MEERGGLACPALVEQLKSIGSDAAASDKTIQGQGIPYSNYVACSTIHKCVILEEA